MTDHFPDCLPLILAHEGGWSDHKDDPGGATMKGVTMATYSDWLGKKATKAQLKAITDAELSAIYRKNYWEAASCDKLPKGLAYMTFDLAVNSGPSRAKRYLQSAVGVIEDGQVGPATLKAVAATLERLAIGRVQTRRDNFYRSLDTFPTFGKGWIRRLNEVTERALEWAAKA